MIRSKLLLCAENVILDSHTNSLSVINIFEDITPDGLPLMLPKFSILLILEREMEDPRDIELSIKIKLDDFVLYEVNQPTSFQDKLKARSIMTIGGLLIQKPGRFSLQISAPNFEPMEYVIIIGTPHNQKPIIVNKS